MYGIIKILPGIKLTFLLIIFGLGGISLHVDNRFSRPGLSPVPEGIYHAGVVPWYVPPDSSEHSKPVVKEGSTGETAEPDESLNIPHGVQNLGELGFHIEL